MSKSKLKNVSTMSDFRRSKIAAELGSMGGKKTLELYGNEHFKDLRAKQIKK